jgi:sn-glycerol 3-phosphate transport system permease protein
MSGSGKTWTARLVLFMTVAAVLLPLVYQFGLSFKVQSEIFRQPLAPISFPPTLANYQRVLSQLPMLQYLQNTLIFAGGVTVGQILLAIPAAYAFSHYQFRFQKLLFALVLLSLMVPFVVTYLPNYLLLANWRMLNTMPGMIVPMLTSGYGIFLLRQHFKNFSSSILEAARIDGANSWQVLWRILVPANISAITALAVYLLVNTWNQYIWPLLVGNDPDVYTLTVAVQRYANSEGGSDWGAMMAVSVLATLPTIVIYIFMRKGIIRTFSEGAVKG